MNSRNALLIADDEESICYSLGRYARTHGYEPLIAYDGLSACRLFEAHHSRIAAVFLDVQMPRMGGVEAFDVMASNDPGVSCCFMTAYTHDAKVRERLQRAPLEVLHKPFGLPEFHTMVRRLMASRPEPELRRTRTIALYFPPRHNLWRDVIRGINRFARAQDGWLITLVPNDDIAALERDCPDGVIGMFWCDRIRQAVRDWGGPAVDTGPNFAPHDFASIGLADIEVGRLAAVHLLEHGSRHLSVLPQPGVAALELFARGFAERVRLAGRELSHAPADLYTAASPDALPSLVALRDWITTLPLPAAVFAVHDGLAFRLVEACRMAGLGVPEDVAIVGALNDDLICESSSTTLSSVAVPGEKLGFDAAGLLARLFNGADKPRQRIELPPTGVCVRQSTLGATVTDPDVSRALAFIRARAGDRIGVKDIADECGLSRATLQRRFRSLVGRGPLAELQRVRLEIAKRLLDESGVPLSEIACRSGYRDSRHFSVVFRKLTGTSPLRYRRRRGV